MEIYSQGKTNIDQTTVGGVRLSTKFAFILGLRDLVDGSLMKNCV